MRTSLILYWAFLTSVIGTVAIGMILREPLPFVVALTVTILTALAHATASILEICIDGEDDDA